MAAPSGKAAAVAIVGKLDTSVEARPLLLRIKRERFVTNANGVLSPERSLDLGVLQRIISKIRGFKRDLADGLSELHNLLDSAACDRSAAVVASWLEDRVSEDEFLDGTDARIGLVR